MAEFNIDPIITEKVVRDRTTGEVGRIQGLQHSNKSGLNVSVFFPKTEAEWAMPLEKTVGGRWYVERQLADIPAPPLDVLLEAPEENDRQFKKQHPDFFKDEETDEKES